jgi:hypothetical protein
MTAQIPAGQLQKIDEALDEDGGTGIIGEKDVV